MINYNYDYFKKSADYIKSVMGDFVPEVGIILGTGFAHVAGRIENKVIIPYKDVPNFLLSTAPSHAGEFVMGTLAGRKVMCMSGRFHAYEGYDFEQLTSPIRVMKLCGVKSIILTNAAGAINESYKVGDVMVIKDHIKFFGFSPLRGANVEEFGPRFFDVQKMYTPELRKIAIECAKKTNITVHEGVYFYFPGPQFETPAEIKAARILGGDMAGMSTVTEALTAAHCGMPLLGLSLAVNMAAGMTEAEVTTEEVDVAGEKMGPILDDYICEILKKMP